MTRYDEILRNLQEAITDSYHMYTEEEIIFMKKQLRALKESKQEFLRESKNGFGS